MKPKEKPDRIARVSLRLLVVVAACLGIPLLLLGAGPQWWSDQNLIVPGATPNDYAAGVQGQLKNMATGAIAMFDSRLPGLTGSDAGAALHALGTQLSATNAQTSDYSAFNLGQLKAVAAPFYDRLIASGYMMQYPWAVSTHAPNDYAMANIGQMKNLFSFDLPTTSNPNATDSNGLPYDWQLNYFGMTGINPSSIDPADGLTYMQDYLEGRTPNKGAVADTGGGSVALQVYTPLQQGF